MQKRFSWCLWLALALACGCRTPPRATPAFSRFTGIDRFDQFTRTTNAAGETVLLSPPIPAGMNWDQLVVAWNVDAPPGAWLRLEAAALRPGHPTRFYHLADWSPDNRAFPRASPEAQTDNDGEVETDTLSLAQPATAVQLRLTLGGPGDPPPRLKYLGLSFCNTRVPPPLHPPNRAAWGKSVPTPAFSQHGWTGSHGWCSPTALAMVLAHWAEVLHRPELAPPVPAVAAGVYDQNYGGTGNWPFNTAFAGAFPGLRALVTRFDDLSEVEEWTAAGVPVILSTRWDQLAPGRPPDGSGHLIVCTGFTPNGDLLVNDPATAVARLATQPRVYRRENVLRAWAQSHHTVYLVYPETLSPPVNQYRQW